MLIDQKNQYCKITILSKAIYRFTATSIKLPMSLFTEIEQNILLFLFKKIATTFQRKKNGAEVIKILSSNYTRKLQQTKQYGIGRKTDMQINGTG